MANPCLEFKCPVTLKCSFPSLLSSPYFPSFPILPCLHVLGYWSAGTHISITRRTTRTTMITRTIAKYPLTKILTCPCYRPGCCCSFIHVIEHCHLERSCFLLFSDGVCCPRCCLWSCMCSSICNPLISIMNGAKYVMVPTLHVSSQTFQFERLRAFR